MLEDGSNLRLVMKKKSAHRHAKAHKTPLIRPGRNYLVVIRGWMFIVLFAIMLGVGAVIGSYLNTLMDASTPQVAGVSTER